MPGPRTVVSIALAGAVCTLAAPLSGCARGGGRPSIVLVVIDTLRADELECYGSTIVTAPRLARMATEGALFEDAFAASPWTTPSVASIVTGLYPEEAGVRSLRDPLPASARTLAERLGEAGYATGAVISNALAGPPYRLDQGYDQLRFERYLGEPGRPRTELRPVFTAEHVTDRALEMVPALRPPFFLYVHYTDPHEPYLPPRGWSERYLGGRAPLELAQLVAPAYLRSTPEEVERARAHYRGAIAFTDQEIGRLRDRLPEGTLLIVTSDHGEEFRDHGGLLHGHTLFQELLHVPLLVAGPGVSPGLRVRDPVSHVDLAPTILDFAGVAAGNPSLSGVSLRQRLRGGAAPAAEQDRPLFAALESHGPRYEAVRRGPWKLHRRPDGRFALFDLRGDPLERFDLAAERKDEAESLLARLAARGGEAAVAAVPADEPGEEERLEELRALGYVH